MLILPSLLIGAATEAGIETPPEDELMTASYDRNKYPYWHVLCITQLNRPMSPGEHFENAKNLVKIPIAELMAMTFEQLQAAGCNCGV